MGMIFCGGTDQAVGAITSLVVADFMMSTGIAYNCGLPFHTCWLEGWIIDREWIHYTDNGRSFEITLPNRGTWHFTKRTIEIFYNNWPHAGDLLQINPLVTVTSTNQSLYKR